MTYFATSYETDPDVRLLMLDEIAAVSGGTAMEEDMEANDAYCTALAELTPLAGMSAALFGAAGHFITVSPHASAVFTALGVVLGVSAAAAELAYYNWCEAGA